MHKQRKNRKVFIFSLLSMLLLMSVGYAAFSQKLEIKGTSQITSKWDIEIINISEPTLNGYAEEVSKSIGEDKVSAYMEVNLYEKEDYAEYIVTVKNKGNLDAVLNNINVGTSNNSAVDITFECENRNKEYVDCNSQDEKEPLKANETKNIKVKIGYNKDYEGGETVGEASIGLEYTQTEYEPKEPEGFKSKDQYLLTYNSSGGKETYKSIYLYKGDSVDLTKIVTKDYYVFKGWNTDSNADRGLTKEELNQCDIEEENNDCKELAETMLMPEEDTTLYAIFKEDEISLDFSTVSSSNRIIITPQVTVLSGVAQYSYTIDGSGAECQSGTDDNVCVIEGLKQNTSYEIAVTLISNSGLTDTVTKTVTTKSLTQPTYSQSKNVTSIIYQELTLDDGTVINCSNGFICEYSLDDGETYTRTYDNVQEITFSHPGNIIARISDGDNTERSTYTFAPWAVDLYYNNEKTKLTCETAQCAIDKIKEMLE